MKELESKLIWQKIQLNSTFNCNDFYTIYEERFQMEKKLQTLRVRVFKIKKIFNEQV